MSDSVNDRLSDRTIADLPARLRDLKLIGFDIDGVFTDGRFYLSDDGVESKAFNTQDGYGIRRLLDDGIEHANESLQLLGLAG